MKFRCTENSIRLRLRRSEIKQLEEQQQVGEQIGYPGGIILDYQLSVKDQKNITASLEAGKVHIQLPATLASDWITTNQVSINHHFELPDGSKLYLLIEKDFPCKTRVDEDKADTFQELVPKEQEKHNC